MTNSLEQRKQALKSQQTTKAKADWFTTISVNRSSVDLQGTALPMGKFKVTVNDITGYLDEVPFVVVTHGVQYIKFGGDNKLIGATVIEDDFFGEFKDSTGGFKLGRPSTTKGVKLTPEQKAAKAYLHVFGLADVSKAVDINGKPAFSSNVSMVPAVFKVTGKKLIDKINEIVGLVQNGEAHWEFQSVLTKPSIAGVVSGVPYYTFSVVRTNEKSDVSEEFLTAVEGIIAKVAKENERLLSMHNKRNGGGIVVEEDDSSLEIE